MPRPVIVLPHLIGQGPHLFPVQNPKPFRHPLQNPLFAQLRDQLHQMTLGDGQVLGYFRVFYVQDRVVLQKQQAGREIIAAGGGGQSRVTVVLGHVLLQRHAAAEPEKLRVLQQGGPAAPGVHLDEAALRLRHDGKRPFVLFKQLRYAEKAGWREKIDQGLPAVFVKTVQLGRAPHPVSYTHLDVYKRQCGAWVTGW